MEIFLIVMIVLCVIFLITFIFLILFTIKRDKKHNPKEQLMMGNPVKSALLIYQPSIHKGNIALSNSLAVTLHELGYNVTINVPSDKLKYNFSDYDILVFCSGVYMGKAASPIYSYLKKNRKYYHKKVFIFLTGIETESSKELKALSKLITIGNDIYSLKIQKNEIVKATDFIKEKL